MRAPPNARKGLLTPRQGLLTATYPAVQDRRSTAPKSRHTIAHAKSAWIAKRQSRRRKCMGISTSLSVLAVLKHNAPAAKSIQSQRKQQISPIPPPSHSSNQRHIAGNRVTRRRRSSAINGKRLILSRPSSGLTSFPSFTRFKRDLGGLSVCSLSFCDVFHAVSNLPSIRT